MNSLSKAKKMELRLFVESDQMLLFLQYIRVGADPISACAAIGVAVRSLHTWLAIGAQGLDDNATTLYRETIKAIGEALVTAEAEIKLKDPKWWILNGPKKYLGADLYRKTIEQIEAADQDTKQDTESNAIDYMEALIELRSAGIDLNNMVDTRIKQLGGETIDAEEYKEHEKPIQKLIQSITSD